MALEPAPLERNQAEVVENIHGLPGQPEGQPVPDYDSREHMENFLEERQRQPEGRIRQRFGRWRVYDTVQRTAVRFDRWRYLPPVKDGRGWRRASVAAFLTLNAAVNLINGNLQKDVANFADDVAEEISGIKDAAQDSWELRGSELCEPNTIEAEKETETIERQTQTFVYSPNEVGESNPEATYVDKILDVVEEAQGRTDLVKLKVGIRANTSDEWIALGKDLNWGIGSRNVENEQLGDERSTDSSSLLELRAAERGIDVSGIVIEYHPEEHILDDETQLNLTWLANQYGYENIKEVLDAQKANRDELPEELNAEFDRHFARNRDTILTVESESKTTTVRYIDKLPPESDEDCVDLDGTPEDENHDYDLSIWPFLWPALPWFMKKRVEKLKGAWIDAPDVHEPQRLLIHEDAVQENNELLDSAWAYVRKYMYLFREDDRIQKVFEHEYTDESGERQTLRALFVDHEPTIETTSRVRMLFEAAGQIDGGRLGRECDAILVYPSDNAGLHGDAKKVGLGLDIQYEDSVLGVAIPSLGIIEMHMPEAPTIEEVDRDYNSAMWVLAHELAGHFSDTNDEPNTLEQVGQTAQGKPLYVLPDRFAYNGENQYQRADRQEERADQDPDSIRWAVRRGRETLRHNSDRTEQTVRGVDDYRLAESLHVRKQTGNPSRYGSGSDGKPERTAILESWAEASANEMTGIAIPYRSAAEHAIRMSQVASENPDLFVDGYHISDDWRSTLSQMWGSLTHEDSVSFPQEVAESQNWSHQLGAPDEFEFTRELARWARSVETPEPTNPVWTEIVVGQAMADQLAEEQAKRKILV